MTDDNNEDTNEEQSADKFTPLEEGTCEIDEHTYGVAVHGDPDSRHTIKMMMDDVNLHGEVHATVEEHEKELEVRQGTAVFNFEAGVISIDTGRGYQRLKVPMDRIVDWEEPYDPWH